MGRRPRIEARQLADRAFGRLLTACLATAARRWPDSHDMAREWSSEIAALRDNRSLRPWTRTWRSLTFAVSIACTPSPQARGTGLCGWAPIAIAGVALLAAGLFDGIHDVNFAIGPHLPPAAGIAANMILVALAMATMAWIGAVAARRTSVSPVTATAALGLAMYVFLMAGNHTAVMPFMGWRDVAPAVLAWVVLTAIAVTGARGLSVAGHRVSAWAVGIVGAAATLEVAAVCGSLHAVASLHLGFGAAPSWFPVSLLPVGTAAAVSGQIQTPDLLLGNVSAMVGPMLLGSTFLVTYAMVTNALVTSSLVSSAARDARSDAATRASDPRTPVVRTVAAAAVLVLVILDRQQLPLYVQAPLALVTLAILRWDGSERLVRQFFRWMLLIVGAAAVSVPIYDSIYRSGSTIDRIATNTDVFGFGFATTPAGQLLVAAVLGVLAVRWIVPPDPATA